jgi:hypothetical protein
LNSKFGYLPSDRCEALLEFTMILGQTAVWQPVGTVISQTGNLSSVTLSTGPATTYYRMHK